MSGVNYEPNDTHVKLRLHLKSFEMCLWRQIKVVKKTLHKSVQVIV